MEFLNKVVAFINTLLNKKPAETVADITEAANSVVETVVEAAKPVVESVTETAEAVIEAVVEAAKPVVESVAETAEAVVEAVQAIVEKTPTVASPTEIKTGSDLGVPEDSILRRHYLAKLEADRRAVSNPYPTDSILRRHYEHLHSK